LRPAIAYCLSNPGIWIQMHQVVPGLLDIDNPSVKTKSHVFSWLFFIEITELYLAVTLTSILLFIALHAGVSLAGHTGYCEP